MVRQPVRRRLQQSFGTVAEHSGQEHRNTGPGPVPGRTVEKHVDRRAVRTLLRLNGIMQAVILAHHQVIVGSREQNLTRGRPMSFSGQQYAAARLLREPLAQTGSKRRINVLNDDDTRLQACGKSATAPPLAPVDHRLTLPQPRAGRASFRPVMTAFLKTAIPLDQAFQSAFSPACPGACRSTRSCARAGRPR